MSSCRRRLTRLLLTLLIEPLILALFSEGTLIPGPIRDPAQKIHRKLVDLRGDSTRGVFCRHRLIKSLQELDSIRGGCRHHIRRKVLNVLTNPAGKSSLDKH